MLAMRPRSLVRLLLISGAVLCIPGAAGVIVFAQGSELVTALDAARPCATPSRDANADCLSFLNGRITDVARAGKSNDMATIALEQATVTAVYSTTTSLQQGSSVVTEWWRGRLVALGLLGTSPNVITDQNPVWNLETLSIVLALVIPGVWALVAGLLVLQAPMTWDELIKASLARWPDPPRPVERVVAWRTACGGSGIWVALFAWVFLYVSVGIILVSVTNQPRYAPLILVATFVLSFGLTEWFAAGYLSQVVRTADKRTVVVQKLERGLGRYRNATQIWYGLNDSRVDTQMLDAPWDGHVNEGDRLDVLADPKSGTIWRILSTPPA
jgi:hypothetical protein